MLQDSFVGHIVENDVTVHGLTVRMEQLMDLNKNFQVIYGAKVSFFIAVSNL
jgi:hypothetical protein